MPSSPPFVRWGRLHGREERGSFGPISPGDSDTFAFDFTPRIGTATISSAAWTCALQPYQPPIDATPQSHITGTPSSATSILMDEPAELGGPLTTVIGIFSLCTVGGFLSGQGGLVYRIAATIGTSDGRTLEMSANLPVAT